MQVSATGGGDSARPSIRRAAPADAGILADLVGEYWRFEGIPGFDHQRTSATLHAFLEDPALGACWLALDADNPVGYLLAVLVFSLEHGGMTAEIDELFVVEACRRTGAGTLLLEQAEKHFRQLGCRNISLQLGRTNEVGGTFYRQRGYRPRTGYALLEKDV